MILILDEVFEYEAIIEELDYYASKAMLAWYNLGHRPNEDIPNELAKGVQAIDDAIKHLDNFKNSIKEHNNELRQ